MKTRSEEADKNGDPGRNKQDKEENGKRRKTEHKVDTRKYLRKRERKQREEGRWDKVMRKERGM